MAKSYEITSEEGRTYYKSLFPYEETELELGDSVELALEDHQERALIAAGWLSEPAKKKKEG